MNMCKKRYSSFLALLLALLVFVAGMGIAYTVDRSGGNVKLQDVYFTSTQDGGLMHGRLYIPKNAAPETPAPALIFVMGNDADCEKYSMISVEMSRRGFVVLSYDLRGQGNSEGKTGFYPPAEGKPLDSMGVLEAAEYMRSLSIVDNENLTIGGHSLGGVAAVRAASAHPEWFKGALLMGIATYDFGVPTDRVSDAAVGGTKWASTNKLLPFIDDEQNMNICLITGRDDGDAKNHAGVAAFCGLSSVDEFESGKVYGSFENNNARLNYQAQNAVHNAEYMTPSIIRVCIDFMQQVSPAANPIDGSKQVWQWRYVGTALSMFAMFFMLLPLGNILLGTQFFSSVVAEVPEYKGNRGTKWWIFAVITAIVGPLTYFHFSNWSVKWINTKIWNVQRATCTLGWALGVAGITLAMLIIFSLITKKEKRPGLVNYGLSYGKGTVVNIAKSLLLAAIMVLAIYALLAVQYRWTHIDARLWNISLRVLNGTRVLRFLKYLVPFAVAFIILSANLFGTLRAKGGELSVCKEILINVALLAPWYLVWAIWFGPFAWLKANGALPSFSGMMYAFFWASPLTMGLFAVVTTYFNRKTGRVYLGAFVIAMVITWIMVGGFSMLLG